MVWSILERPDEVEIGSDICMSNLVLMHLYMKYLLCEVFGGL